MSGEIATQDQRFGQLRQLLQQNQAAIQAALPKHMDPDRMVRLALTCFRQVPKLMECTPRSVMGAIVQASQLGLEPGNGLGHAYLIPFWNGQKKVMECQFMAGYRGLIELAMRSNKVATVTARNVYEKDKFELSYGTDERVMHIPFTGKARGNKIGVYCVVTMTDGNKLLDFLTEEDVEHAKASSQTASKGFGPWKDHEDEMWRKTAVRRALKYAPLSSELARTLMLDEQAEVQSQHFDVDLGPEDPEPKAQPRSLEAAVGMQESPTPIQDKIRDNDGVHPGGSTVRFTQPEQKRRGRPPNPKPTPPTPQESVPFENEEQAGEPDLSDL